jgi:GH25 family lysozyme M1 (1,4-beta-N-acetylmuramidase)
VGVAKAAIERHDASPMPELLLPDVSEYQPDVQWKDVVAANGGAAIIRAMYGSVHVDAAWYGGARRQSAHEAGVRVLGIYQYLVAAQPVAPQAEAFVATLGHLQPGEFAILDLEEGEGDQAERATAWFEAVDAHLTYSGYRGAWLYSDQAFFQEHNLMVIAESSRHTWVACYDATPPTVPHTLWQYSDAAPWNGIGQCDSSKYAGTLEQLAQAVAAPA